MSNVAEVREAVFAFIDQIDPNATAALLLRAHELALLHYILEVEQEHLKLAQADPDNLTIFYRLRAKVEDVLSKAGYGEAPRNKT